MHFITALRKENSKADDIMLQTAYTNQAFDILGDVNPLV